MRSQISIKQWMRIILSWRSEWVGVVKRWIDAIKVNFLLLMLLGDNLACPLLHFGWNAFALLIAGWRLNSEANT